MFGVRAYAGLEHEHASCYLVVRVCGFLVGYLDSPNTLERSQIGGHRLDAVPL